MNIGGNITLLRFPNKVEGSKGNVKLPSMFIASIVASRE